MIEINGNKVVFTYCGEAENVFLKGDFNNFQPERMIAKREDLWVLEKEFPLNARFDYKFVVDGKEMLDAENPFVSEGGFGFSSELRMPRFHYPIATKYHKSIKHGRIAKYSVSDKIYFRYKRDIYIYIPPFTRKEKIALVFQDGLEYILFGAAKNTLDYLINKGKIPPVYGIFVDIRKDRRLKEYSDCSRYDEFILGRVVPFCEKMLGFSFRKKFTVGVSLGGFVSVAAILKNPSEFAGAVSQSGVLLFKEDEDFSPLKNKKIYMDAGRYETRLDMSMNVVHTNKFFAKLFAKNGADVIVKLWNDGHSWGNWKAHLPFALEKLLGGKR
jgi:enterochelin esterase-like enzyme